MTSQSISLLAGAFAAAVLPTSALLAQAAPAAAVVPLTPAQINAMLDPQMANVITAYKMIMGTPLIKLTPQDARQQFSAEDAAKAVARATGAQLAPMPVGKITDGLTIEGSDGNQIPIRIYTPKGTGPFPVVVYYHGGGFVIATIDTYDASARALCDFANAIVVSVEYRKAPEAPYPAAEHDAVSAYKWTLYNIGNYDGNAAKVAVAGESAGGNLAAEVAIIAPHHGLRAPVHQLLIYPETTSDLSQTSDILYENAIPLNTAALHYFDGYYVPDPSKSHDTGVQPIYANVTGVAPATIIAAELDPLQSDGQAYAAKLKAAGVPVSYMLYTGTTHEFFGMGAVVDKALAAEKYGAAQLAASFK